MAVIIINRHNTKKILPFNFLLELERYFTCKNIGCRASLKWRMQLSRHLKNCPHEKPTKEYSIQNGQYACGKCSKKIKPRKVCINAHFVQELRDLNAD